MKKYWKFIITAAAFVVFMVVVSVAYTKLSQEYKPQQNLVAQGGNTGETGQSEMEAVGGSGTGQEQNGSATGATQEGSGTGQNDTHNQAGADSGDAAEPESAEEEAVMAVDFTVEDAAGEAVNLLSFVGKPIVLNFWASWCGPCKSELPDFQAAYENYEGEIEFVMVNMTDGSRETKDIATEFWTDAGYTLPILYDTTQEAAYTYGISSLPTTFFINAEGEIVAWAQGMIDAETLELGISMIQ